MKRLRPDGGETLVELLIALMVLGTGVVAVISAVDAGVSLSGVHRQQATADALVRSYAEAVQASVEAGGYAACATTAAYATPPGFALPAGFSAGVSAVEYWTAAGGWSASCAHDTGVQRLTLGVTSSDSRVATQSLEVVVRKPCLAAQAVCS